MKTLISALFVLAIAGATYASISPLGGVILAGPSGTVLRSGLVGPVGLGHVAVAAPAAVPLAAAQAALSLSVPAGSGLEGQWIPDINEKLHDDGSWRPLQDGSLLGASPLAWG